MSHRHFAFVAGAVAIAAVCTTAAANAQSPAPRKAATSAKVRADVARHIAKAPAHEKLSHTLPAAPRKAEASAKLRTEVARQTASAAGHERPSRKALSHATAEHAATGGSRLDRKKAIAAERKTELAKLEASSGGRVVRHHHEAAAAPLAAVEAKSPVEKPNVPAQAADAAASRQDRSLAALQSAAVDAPPTQSSKLDDHASASTAVNTSVARDSEPTSDASTKGASEATPDTNSQQSFTLAAIPPVASLAGPSRLPETEADGEAPGAKQAALEEAKSSSPDDSSSVTAAKQYLSLSDRTPIVPKEHMSYLALYAYSEVPPPRKPADIALDSLRSVPVGTPLQEIKRAADAFGLDFSFMRAVAKIESDFNPKQRTGSYIGLFQLSHYEFAKYGSGEITNPRDNAIAAAYKFINEGLLFELDTHKDPSFSDLYLIHQQGWQGAAEHVAHPERIAWKSMCATDEGKEKGERWCKRAIWQNTLPAIKHLWKSVDNLTSSAFVSMWRTRVEALYSRFSTKRAAAN
jgi:hypothetical protein